MKKIYVIHSSNFEYEKDLYEPLKNQREFEFIFPHDKENEIRNSKELIGSCDVILAEVSFPSTGSGIEIGRAECAGIPVVAIFKKGITFSSALNFVTENIIEYQDLEKDFEKIKGVINKL